MLRNVTFWIIQGDSKELNTFKKLLLSNYVSAALNFSQTSSSESFTHFYHQRESVTE